MSAGIAFALFLIGMSQLAFGFSYPVRRDALICRWIGSVCLVGSMVSCLAGADWSAL